MMKTWEMIKMLSQSPGKEFERVQDGLIMTTKKLRFSWGSGYQPLGVLDEWKEVARPVDFMTALNAWSEENKTIKCVYLTPSFFKGSDSLASFGAGQIRHGKWYVVEDEEE